MGVKVTIKMIPKSIKAIRKEFPEMDNFIQCSEDGKFEHVEIPTSKFSSKYVSDKIVKVSRLLSTTTTTGVVIDRYLYEGIYIIVTKFASQTVITLSGGYSV